jgi:ABC-type glycerol-3-phosphate transport system permease component
MKVKLKLNRKQRLVREKAIAYVLVAIASIFFVTPLLWMLITALKSTADLSSGVFWPSEFYWTNFTTAIEAIPFMQYTFNSLYYGLFATIGMTLSCTLASYSFAKLKWTGKNKWFIVMIATLVIPTQVLQVPLFILYTQLGWIDTYNPLIIPAYFAVGGAANIFLLRQFFMGVPNSLRESAKIDGANEFQIFFTIMVPLLKSMVVVVAIMTFLSCWNDFYNPLLYISDSDLYPLAYAIRTFATQYSNQNNLIMAASLIVTLPSLILFFIAQKQIIGSIYSTGIKG